MYDIIVILRYISCIKFTGETTGGGGLDGGIKYIQARSIIYWHIDFKLILHIVSKIKEEIKRHIGKTVIKDTALLL